MNKHVLVTGGAGYVGGAAVRLLLENNYHVTIVDDLSRGHRSSVPSAVPLVVGDVGDPSVFRKSFRQTGSMQ
jgi:UDP-glucose 4-epimerase